MVRHTYRWIGVLASLVVVLLPTVVFNSAVWAQCDVIYAVFCVAALYYLLRRRPYLAALFFGVAFSLKLQAIFVFPLLLVLFALRQIPRQSALLIPIVYGALALPAWLIGRSGRELLTIYVAQAGGYGDLSLNAPSVFMWFAIPSHADLFNRIGVLFAGGVVLVLALGIVSARRPLNDSTILAAAAMFAVAVPFFLPRMHERYFFLADVLTAIVAFYRPSQLWWAPLAMQVASFNSYIPFLFSTEVEPATGLHPHFLAGIVFTVMLCLIRVVMRDIGLVATLRVAVAGQDGQTLAPPLDGPAATVGATTPNRADAGQLGDRTSSAYLNHTRGR
jgi:Gpi18-like mannosyltransferase